MRDTRRDRSARERESERNARKTYIPCEFYASSATSLGCVHSWHFGVYFAHRGGSGHVCFSKPRARTSFLHEEVLCLPKMYKCVRVCVSVRVWRRLFQKCLKNGRSSNNNPRAGSYASIIQWDSMEIIRFVNIYKLNSAHILEMPSAVLYFCIKRAGIITLSRVKTILKRSIHRTRI